MIRALVVTVIAGLFLFVVFMPAPTSRTATVDNFKSVKAGD